MADKFRTWTHTALYCNESNQDCSNCNIFNYYGFHQDGKIIPSLLRGVKEKPGYKKCFMPESLEELKNVPIPREFKILHLLNYDIQVLG